MTEDIIEEEIQIAGEQDNKKEKQLSPETFELMISELKPPKPVTVERGTPIGETIILMQKNSFGSVLITDDGELCGIITERDILMKVAGLGIDLARQPVDEFMTEDPLALMAEDAITYVMNNMHVGGYRHVPIVDEKRKPIGIVSIKDVMSFILDQFPEEVTNVLGEPYRGKSLRESA
tara:strand:+ start:780 stop:1313 length:534 start_codon:yes stop_codon:yes gene_type:complete